MRFRSADRVAEDLAGEELHIPLLGADEVLQRAGDRPVRSLGLNLEGRWIERSAELEERAGRPGVVSEDVIERRSAHRLGLQEWTAALDEPAPALSACELVLLDDHLSAREHDRGLALDAASLVRVVVDAHVVRLRRDRRRRSWIPHHDVGVATDRNGPLLR